MNNNASRIAAKAEGRLQRGTSLYHTRTHEVMCVTEIHEDTVQMTTRSDAFEMDREALIKQVGERDIVIETQPVQNPVELLE